MVQLAFSASSSGVCDMAATAAMLLTPAMPAAPATAAVLVLATLLLLALVAVFAGAFVGALAVVLLLGSAENAGMELALSNMAVVMARILIFMGLSRLLGLI